MLARDELKVSVLRMLKAELMKIQTDGTGTEISEELIQTVIQKMIKQRKDSFEQFTNGGRVELAEKEAKEIALLQAYLPEQMSVESIRVEFVLQKKPLALATKAVLAN